ncbi:hypothetical protein CDL60_20950 [Roseateles noduli]|nr:hypothetical protein CDL60_20950 [Roseateles noduli]
MANSTSVELVAAESISLRIAVVRGQRVLTDTDLAALYGVETGRLNEAMKRNLSRFPEDFMFTLSAEEFSSLRSQLATSNDAPAGRGGRRCAPRVFTEHGALMAATILSSPRAVEVSLYVVRAFIRLRELAASHADIAHRLGELEARTEALAQHQEMFSRHADDQFKQVFEALRDLMKPSSPSSKRPIGFLPPTDDA